MARLADSLAQATQNLLLRVKLWTLTFSRTVFHRRFGLTGSTQEIRIQQKFINQNNFPLRKQAETGGGNVHGIMGIASSSEKARSADPTVLNFKIARSLESLFRQKSKQKWRLWRQTQRPPRTIRIQPCSLFILVMAFVTFHGCRNWQFCQFCQLWLKWPLRCKYQWVSCDCCLQRYEHLQNPTCSLAHIYIY